MLEAEELEIAGKVLMEDKIELFICYAHEDEALMRELEGHLGALELQGLIKIWHDRKVVAGAEWQQVVTRHLRSADIILLLVSSAFMASEYTHNVEVKLAMERQNAGTAHVIPIILRPVYYGGALFAELKVLPTNRKALTSWSNSDEAYFNITEGIREAIEEIRAKKGISVLRPVKPDNNSAIKEQPMSQASTPQGKKEFDVFLCHNGKDKPEVKRIGELLRAQGIAPWLDEWELRPGLPWQRALEEQIEHIKSAAVFVGSNGRGPWQDMELEALIREFVDRGCPVIPVVLADAPDKPQLPPFLRGMTWVDFRKSDPNPMERLIWGITGTNPNAGGSAAGSGGSQNVQGQASVSGSTPPAVPTGLTPRKRRDLEKKRDMLLEEQNTRNERLKATRKAWTIEMNPGIKFQLGAQIKDDEEALAGLETELDKIEQELQ
jgi:hypothetical protein